MAPADRRALILQAAAAMFRDHGYAGASVDAIAAASGISGPGIYRYFSGKAELLLALLESAVADTVAAIDVVPDRPAQTSDALADILAERALSEGAIIALLHGTAGTMEPEERLRLDQLRRDAVGRLADALHTLRPDLAAAEAEARIIAALALVGNIERFLATGVPAQSFQTILRAILRV
ncbi:MAG: TetR/AcrR family transcriptional regulator [Sphingopyxis sp.]|uniref:TetR/AcrR family transcriptional regulator n=1 Tax=Sphingopyxis sp. TaxID=1908224 RepID=UPI003D80BC2F